MNFACIVLSHSTATLNFKGRFTDSEFFFLSPKLILRLEKRVITSAKVISKLIGTFSGLRYFKTLATDVHLHIIHRLHSIYHVYQVI